MSNSKSVTLTTNEARIAYEALMQLGFNKLPSKAAYWIARLQSKLKADYDASEDLRKKIILEQGIDVPGRDGEKYINDKDVAAVLAFNEAWNPIGAELLTLDAPTLSVDSFGAMEIEPRYFAALMPFLLD